MRGCWQMVFQQPKGTSKQVLDGIVSAMENSEKMAGVERIEKC
jgi:hypothetical protein